MAYNIIIPITVFVFCIMAGFLIEKLIRSKIVKNTVKNSLNTQDVIFGAFKGMVILWLSLAGAYFALLWLFNGASWMNLVYKVLVAAAIVSVTIVIMRIATGLVRNYSKKAEGLLPSTSIFENLTKLLVFVIGILVLLSYLDIAITPILTALGVGGLAVALALQDTLSNIFAGIQILISRQIKTGDYIRLDTGEEGFISDISWRNTSIRMLSNNLILVPNSKISNAIVTNYELPESEMSVVVNVTVGYSSDLEKIERMVYDAAAEVMKEVDGGVPDFVPSAKFSSFTDFGINLSAVLRARSFSDQYIVKHEFIKRLHKRFSSEDIEMPFPVRTIHYKQ